MSLAKPFWFLCLITILACGGCATTSKDPVSRYSTSQLQRIGEKFLAAGDAGQAMKYLTLAEQKKPKDPVILYDLGLAYNGRGLQNEALSYFQKALAEKPDYAEAYNAIGALYAERGQFSLAQESFQKAISNPYYPTPEIGYYNLGRLYEKQGDYEAALKQYQEAIRLHANYGHAFYRMGVILESLKRGDEAKRAYGKAIGYTPDLAEAHLRYGILCSQAGETEQAVFSLTRVMKLAPNTTLSEEAKRCLDRIEPVTLGTPQQPTAVQPPEKPSRAEAIGQPEVRQVEPANRAGPPAAPVQAVQYPREQPLPPSQAPAAEAAPQGGSLQAAQPEQQVKFVVQVGSFVDKDKADEMQAGLLKKGYPAVVRQAKNQALGTVYIIQLKPVDTLSKATTLMTQIEGEVQAKPTIIRVPGK